MKTPYQFIIDGIIPSTQEAFKRSGVNKLIRKEETDCVRRFKKAVSDHLSNNKPGSFFPTSSPVFIAIVQFFTSAKRDYRVRDVDNMAKTILDILQQNGLYKDDAQVRTLVVTKRVDINKVPQNLGFIHVEILDDEQDVPVVSDFTKDALKLYEDLKKGNVVIQ